MASWSSWQYFSMIILLTVLFGACSGKDDKPKDILNKKDMIHLMIEIHLLEGKMGRLSLIGDTAKQVYNHFEKVIFKDAGVDSTTYYRSFDHYSSHPNVFSSIYEAVVDSLIEMETKLKLIADQPGDKLESDSSKVGLTSFEDDTTRRFKPPKRVKLKKSDSTSEFRNVKF